MADDEPPPPPNDPLNAASSPMAGLEERIAKLESQQDLDKLSAEGLERQLLISEIRQRIWIRWLTIGLALIVMIFMAAVLWHSVHSYFRGSYVMVPHALAVAMFLGPVVSITTITVMLAIGAFRKLHDQDIGPAGIASLAAEGAKSALSP